MPTSFGKRKEAILALFVAVGLAWLLSSTPWALPAAPLAGDPPSPIETVDPERAYREPSPDPIFDEAAAIARTLAMIPPGHEPLEPVARMMRRLEAERWLQGPYADAWSTDQAIVAASSVEEPPYRPDSPCWLVGIRGSGLTVDDVIPIPGGVGDSSPVEGAFVLWDASSGDMLSQGALETTTWTNLASIAALTSEAIPVTPMRATLVFIDATAMPTPTFSAEEWATNDAALTEIALTPSPPNASPGGDG